MSSLRVASSLQQNKEARYGAEDGEDGRDGEGQYLIAVMAVVGEEIGIVEHHVVEEHDGEEGEEETEGTQRVSG